MATDPQQKNAQNQSPGIWYPITGGAQIAELLKVQINAVAFKADQTAPQLPCVGTPKVLAPQPLQMLFADVWSASYNTPIKNPVGVSMNLASNTVIVPPRAKPGQTVELALTYAPSDDAYQPRVVFTNPDGSDCVDVKVLSYGTPASVTYAVPGNTYPSTNSMVPITVQVSPQATPSVLGLRMIPTDGSSPPAIPAFLTIATA